MKLKIIKNIVLANPAVSLPHWFFKKDEIIDTEDNYLITRLKDLHAAIDQENHADNVNNNEIFENKMVDIDYRSSVLKKRGRPKK